MDYDINAAQQYIAQLQAIIQQQNTQMAELSRQNYELQQRLGYVNGPVAPQPGPVTAATATRAISQQRMGYGEIAGETTKALLTGGLSLIGTASKRRKNRTV